MGMRQSSAVAFALVVVPPLAGIAGRRGSGCPVRTGARWRALPLNLWCLCDGGRR